MAEDASILVRGARKSFGKVQALRGVDLTIRRGTIHCLLGPNGAGKTTLLRILAGATKADEGTAEILGMAMPRQSRAVRSRLGYMPQVPAVYGDLTVRANIRFFARAHGIPHRDPRIGEILAMAELEGMAERRVDTLSGGFRQRCSLACAMVHQPDVLLLDEPTAGMDPLLKTGFWNHFRRLASEGRTILISTHLMDEPLLCDRLSVLRNGLMLVEDTPERILARGRTRVRIRRGGEEVCREIGSHPEDLPGSLREHGLSEDITSIALEQDSLEEILVRLIHTAPAE